MIRVFGVPGHAKSEGDHVGGKGGGAKVALHREIAVGIVLIGASHMVDYLATKFQDKKEPQLHSERD